MNTTLNAAVAALAGLAAMGYSLPEWFINLLFVVFCITAVLMLFKLPKMIKMIIDSFKE